MNADLAAALKNAKVSAALLARMAQGQPLPEAFDGVFGAGAYAKTTGDLYDGLRAKAGK